MSWLFLQRIFYLHSSIRYLPPLVYCLIQKLYHTLYDQLFISVVSYIVSSVVYILPGDSFCTSVSGKWLIFYWQNGEQRGGRVSPKHTHQFTSIFEIPLHNKEILIFGFKSSLCDLMYFAVFTDTQHTLHVKLQHRNSSVFCLII